MVEEIKLEKICEEVSLDGIIIPNQLNPKNYNFTYVTGRYGVLENTFLIYNHKEGQSFIYTGKHEEDEVREGFGGEVFSERKRQKTY